MSRRQTAITAMLALTATACGTQIPTGTGPLGRSIAAGPTHQITAATTPPPHGDPPPERGGTIPAQAQAAEHTVTSAGVASSPRQALRRYALSYTNWRASDLHQRERDLAAISVGTAKLTAEQTAAAVGNADALIRSRVANAGKMVGIARGEGPDIGEWVIITLEHTTGTSAYAGLAATTHVTVARVTRVRHGWAVSEWDPEN